MYLLQKMTVLLNPLPQRLSRFIQQIGRVVPDDSEVAHVPSRRKAVTSLA